jgi:hypothetical protein
MSILNIVYASAPTGEVLIPTLEIQTPQETLRICTGFEDHWLGVDGQMALFQAGNLQVALPAKNTSGQQTLKFGLWNVSGRARRYVNEVLESGARAPVIYREYLSSDKSAPAKQPRILSLLGGQFEGDEAVFECGYYDLLNSRWPREPYSAENAPGLKYT